MLDVKVKYIIILFVYLVKIDIKKTGDKMKPRVETKSRFYDLQLSNKPVMDLDGPKNGQEIVTFLNRFGRDKIRAILNYKDGFLNNEPNCPAVQMEDFHTEYWENGKLSNTELNADGELMPAVISDYGRHQEWWANGKKIK